MAKKVDRGDFITLDIINDKELFKLFQELQESVQNKIVDNGFKEAALPIKNEIKTSFDTIKKDKSKTGYKDLNRSLKIEPMKGKVGVKIGFSMDGYKYRWINWGIKERHWKTKSKKSVGAIGKTDFFYKAVERTLPQAQNNISAAILKSLNTTVKKYDK